MIKTIVFDLGGVYFTSGTKIAAERIKKLKGIKDGVKKKIDDFFRGKERKLYGKGKITKTKFWKLFSKKTKNQEKLIPKIQETWHSSYKPNKGMRELVLNLRKNYRVLVFSGNIKERVEYLEKKYGLCGAFDELLLSYEAGFNKHDIEFYKILKKKIKCKPKECICIDNERHVLEKQKSLGMKTILFQNVKQLKKDLKNSGVRI